MASQIREAAALEKQNQLYRQKKEELIGSIALGEGIKYGTMSFVTVGGATVLATLRSQKFNKMMQISAKVSLPVMAGLFFFALKYEHSISSMNRYPHLWEGLRGQNMEKYVKSGKVSTMPIHHRVGNFLYDHPFVMVAGVGIPFVSVVLKQQLQLKHIKFSQRIMHSRVFGQAGILTMAMTIFAFRDWMDKRGRFPESD